MNFNRNYKALCQIKVGNYLLKLISKFYSMVVIVFAKVYQKFSSKF